MSNVQPGMGPRNELVRVRLNGKTYFYPKQEIQRRLERKIDKLARQMPDGRRQAFLQVTGAVTAAIEWSKVHHDIAAKLAEEKSPFTAESPYTVNETINRLLKIVARSVRTTDISQASKVQLALNAAKSARTICQWFDEAAGCWKEHWREIVETHAS